MPKNEIVKISSPNGEIQLSVPPELPSTALAVVIPQIIVMASKEFSDSTGNIIQAVVSEVVETTAKIVFYQEHGRVLREEVIPVIAKAKAYQDGRDILNRMGLDDEILEEAQNELNKRRRLAGDSTTDAPKPKNKKRK